MAKFTVIINTDNDAFGDDPGREVSIILREIANAVGSGMSPKRYFTVPVRDTNGNTVGKYIFTK